MSHLHPFEKNRGYKPPTSCDVIENNFFNSKHELLSMQTRKFRNMHILSFFQKLNLSDIDDVMKSGVAL